MTNVRYQLFVKWRFITSPDVKETECGGRPWEEKTPEEVGEDNYHPDKLIFVGPPFESAQEAADYGTARGWMREDCDIVPYKIVTGKGSLVVP